VAEPSAGDSDAVKARRRLRGLVIHFLGYFAVMAVLVVVNRSLSPETQWFVWPMVGWGGFLAIHTAWAMGLFDILTGDR
jgi:hypothetical protein